MCKGGNFKDVIDFGENPLVNSLLDEEDLDKKEKTFPLMVEQCQDCFLVQIANPIESEKIYTDIDYLYYSSDMPGLRDYFNEYVIDVRDRFLMDDELVVEIGSNDGLLLDLFRNTGQEVLGVDPATNVVVRALAKGIPTLSAPFNKRFARHIAKEFGKAKVICGNNCIAHVDDLDSVMNGVTELLDYEGVFVVECNYWGGMVVNKNYSLIYHDHFSYFTVQNWIDYLKKFDMEVFDAVVTPAQGGSLRLFMSKVGMHSPTFRLQELVDAEKKDKLNSYKTAKYYNKAVTEQATKLHDLIVKLKKDGKKIAGYGAAAKGLSILKLANIGKEHLDFFVDDSPAKQGKYTPISRIPVVSREIAQGYLPDYFFITAPNYKDIIMEKEKDFRDKGGKFITVDLEIL